MALISCPECKKEVSNTIKRCPHCGFVMRRVKWKWWMIGPYAISILAIIFVLVDVHAVVDLTTDTFIGIIASFIGAAVTFIVGWQIFSVLNVQNELRKIDLLYKTLESKQLELDGKIDLFDNRIKEQDVFQKRMKDELYAGIHFLQGCMIFEDDDLISQYYHLAKSIFYNLNLLPGYSDNNVKTSIASLKDVCLKLIENKNKGNNYNQSDYKKIATVFELLTTHQNYKLIKNEFNSVKLLTESVLSLKKIVRVTEVTMEE